MHLQAYVESKAFQTWFGLLKDIGIVAGIFFAAISLLYSGRQTGIMGEQVANQLKIASANYVVQISTTLDGPQFVPIITAIEGGKDNTLHMHNYPILKSNNKGGQFTPSDIDYYLGKLDAIGNLWQSNLVDQRLAYNEFGYDAEKAWCNDDVRNYILGVRKADKNFANDKSFYSSFETLTQSFFNYDGKSCNDLDKE